MTGEQEALLQKAADSIAGAKLLAENRFYNFAVSRAYYAMYYIAQAFLLGKSLTFSKQAGLIAGFGQHFAKTGLVPVEYHRYLIEAQQSRTVGDYEASASLTAEQASEQIERAEAFLELGRELIGPNPFPDVAQED
jgi:uncharacterized protein (UPF0332 family)